METNFTLFRLLIFAALIAGFFAWYSGIPVPRDSYLEKWRVTRAGAACVTVFIAGAYISCFMDLQYGMFPRKSLRAWFVAGGIVLMALAVALVHSFQRAVS